MAVKVVNNYQRYFIAITLILLILALTVSSARAAGVGDTVKIRVGANIRSGPGVSNRVVGSASRGDVFAVKQVDRGWYRIGDGRWISWIVTTEYCEAEENC